MIRIFPDAATLSRAAAALFVRQAGDAARERGCFSVALAGGRTPADMYRLLARPPLSREVDWQRVHIFWGDERCVPPDDPRSNARMAHETFLDHVPIPAEQVHPMACHRLPIGSLGQASRQAAREAARRYEDLLRDFFGTDDPAFDLVLLGLGKNGHTASLFPRSAALRETERWTSVVDVSGQDYHRMTLTAPLINQAQIVVFLVSGAEKSTVLREVLTGPFDPMRLPAQLIRPRGERPLWLVDQSAAAGLDNTAAVENLE
jgi:6-phosphogluconolactonase